MYSIKQLANGNQEVASILNHFDRNQDGMIADKELDTYSLGRIELTDQNRQLSTNQFYTAQAIFRNANLMVEPDQSGLDAVEWNVEAEVANRHDSEARVTHLRQLHNVTYNVSDDQRHFVARYQLTMLRYMVNPDNQPTDIFSEGLTREVTPYNTTEGERIRSLFPDGRLPDYVELTPEQMNALIYQGADYVYACLNEGVTLHPTSTPEMNARGRNIIREMNRTGRETAEQTEFINAARERYTMDQVETFLNANPEAQVMVVYGAAHEFAPYVSEMENGASLLAVNFPELDEQALNVFPNLRQEDEPSWITSLWTSLASYVGL